MWTPIIKKSENKPGRKMIVNFRNKKVIHFSTAIGKEFNIEIGDFVEFFLNDDRSKLGVKFHKEKVSKNCYTASTDGGAKGKLTSFVVQAQGVYSESLILMALANSKPNDSKIECKIIGKNFIEVNLIPMFELSKATIDDIGIYRLIRDDEVVYIGKGKIKDRVSTHKRNGFEFEKYECSVLNDDDDCFKWESHYINKFFSENGKLPLYNRIKGKSI